MEQKTVFVIDDSEDDILLTKMVLSKLGRSVRMEFALSGEEGLAFLRSQTKPPSLVLLDLKMPGMDGLDVLRAIRADERLCPVPVIIVTHSDLESDRDESYRYGANSFLNKSVDLGQFTKHIRNELEKWI
jgi:two-component system response regulator